MERLAQAWAESLTASRSCYRFRLQQSIYTEEEPDSRQHFVTVRLHFDYYDNEN